MRLNVFFLWLLGLSLGIRIGWVVAGRAWTPLDWVVAVVLAVGSIIAAIAILVQARDEAAE